jgi:uncharacterized protein (DUF2345 family)
MVFGQDGELWTVSLNTNYAWVEVTYTAGCNLNVSGDVTLTSSCTLSGANHLSGGNLTIASGGNLTIPSGASLTIDAGYKISISSGGTINMSGGYIFIGI